MNTAALALGVVLGTAGLLARQPTFSTRVVSVRVDALVLDQNGEPIEGLRAGDFEVTDEGVPQTVELIASGEVPVNVVLALDMSESVAGERLTALRGAARAVLSGLRPGDQAALVTFSEIVSRLAPLTADVEAVRAALDVAHASGRTALVDAVYAALLLGQSEVGRTLVILFSDGLDTSSWLGPDAVLQTARRSNAVVYSVAIGAAGRVDFLRDLSRVTGGGAYTVESNQDLRGAFVKILEQFRRRYLLAYTPRGVSRQGWHRLDVRVKTRRATVKAREGYVAGP